MLGAAIGKCAGGIYSKALAMPISIAKLVLCVAAIIVLLTCAGRGQDPPTQIAPRIPDGWTKLPDWAKTNFPFDANVYFDISDSENREPLYLESFLLFDFGEASYFYPGLENEPEYKAKNDENNKWVTRAHEFLRNNVDENGLIRINADARPEAEAILKHYEPAFEKLESAQARPRCFFHPPVDTLGLTFHLHIPRYIAELSGLRCQLELESADASRNAQILLRLIRDTRSLAEDVGQLSLNASETYGFAWSVRPLLESPNLTDGQLNELIAVLNEHYAGMKEPNPVIEAARHGHLMFRNLLRQLESGEYAAQVEKRCEDLGLKNALPLPKLLITELGTFAGIHTNESVLDDEIAALAKTDPKMQDAAKLLAQSRKEFEQQDPVQKLSRQNEADEMGVTLFLLRDLDSMTKEDFAKEVAVLNKRYQQIEAACALPFPESNLKLEVLANQWTADDEWKSTKFLKWFQPKSFLHKGQRRSVLRSGAYLCLAAAMKWQRDQKGAPPETLAQALDNIGVKEIPVDPFSGAPLKMTVLGNRVVVYSVGPDGDDDRAEKRFELYGNSLHGGRTLPDNSPDPDGDVVFQLDYAIGK